jgi:hypothetical protein
VSRMTWPSSSNGIGQCGLRGRVFMEAPGAGLGALGAGRDQGAGRPGRDTCRRIFNCAFLPPMTKSYAMMRPGGLDCSKKIGFGVGGCGGCAAGHKKDADLVIPHQPCLR